MAAFMAKLLFEKETHERRGNIRKNRTKKNANISLLSNCHCKLESEGTEMKYSSQFPNAHRLSGHLDLCFDTVNFICDHQADPNEKSHNHHPRNADTNANANTPERRESKSIEAILLVTSHRPHHTQSIMKLPTRVSCFSSPLSAKNSISSTGPSIHATHVSILLCLVILAASPTLRSGFCAPLKQPNDIDDSVQRITKSGTTVEPVISQYKPLEGASQAGLTVSFNGESSEKLSSTNIGASIDRDEVKHNHGSDINDDQSHDDDMKLLDGSSSSSTSSSPHLSTDNSVKLRFKRTGTSDQRLAELEIRLLKRQLAKDAKDVKNENDSNGKNDK